MQDQIRKDIPVGSVAIQIQMRNENKNNTGTDKNLVTETHESHISSHCSIFAILRYIYHKKNDTPAAHDAAMT